MRKVAITLYDDGDHKCVIFPDLVKCEEIIDSGGDACEGVQANQFLITNNKHAALIDPGGNLTYSRLFMGINDFIFAKDLDYVIASHQDPDIVASLNKWLVGTNCKAIVPELWSRFVPHFCTPGNTVDRLIGIPDRGMEIEIGGATFRALPAHFLHSEGNFHFYDPISKILFTGDVGASLVRSDLCGRPVKDFKAHVKAMEGFHRRYMSSNKVIRFWVNMVRQLDIEMIVPQHGALFAGKPMVEQFLAWLETLQVGIDVVTQDHYKLAS